MFAYMKSGDAILYFGLFSITNGIEDEQGVSPTELKFVEGTNQDQPCLIIVKGEKDCGQQPRVWTLIDSAQSGLLRKRFRTEAELLTGLHASQIRYHLEA